MLSAVWKGLTAVLGLDRRTAEQDFEDGEFRPDHEMDPDFLSSIEARLESLFGPRREDFDCELSTDKLGARFGGYGTFLLDDLSCPPSPVELSSPDGALNNNATLSVPEEPPNQHGTLNHNDYTILEKPTCPLGTLESSMGAFQESLVPIGVNVCLTSSSNKNSLDVIGEHPPESQNALNESPETILQIMTSFPIPGGHILSPLPESVLQLRRGLPSVLRSDEAARMEYQETEEGDFLGQKEHSSMDPKSLSYNGEWIEALFMGDFECQLSAEKFGDKLGGHDTFLLDGLSCPSLVELSSPEGALNENATLSVPQKPPNLHGALNHNDSTISERPTYPRGTMESSERSFQSFSVPAGFPSSTNKNGLDGSGEHAPESQHALDESPGTILRIMTSFPIPEGYILSPLPESMLQLRRGLASVLGSEQAVRMEDQEMEEGEFPPSQKENSSMDPRSVSYNCACQDPSSQTCVSTRKNDPGPRIFVKEDNLDESREHPLESQYFLDESPRTIIQIMTSLPVPGGHLISPLSENVLQLKKRESDDNSPLLQPVIVSPQVWLPGLNKSHIAEGHLSNVNEHPSDKNLLKKVTLKLTSKVSEKQLKNTKKVSTQCSTKGDFVGNNDKCSKSKNKREDDHYVLRPCKKRKKEASLKDLLSMPEVPCKKRKKEASLKDLLSMPEVPGPYVKKRKNQPCFEIDGSVDLPRKRWKQTAASLCIKESPRNLKPYGIKVADFSTKQKAPSRKFVSRTRSQAEDGSYRNSIHYRELHDESYGARGKDARNQFGTGSTSIKCNVGRKNVSSNNGVPKNVDSSKRDKIPLHRSHSKGVGPTKVAFGRGTSKLIPPSGILHEAQTRCSQVPQRHTSSVRCSADAVKVVKESNLQNLPREATTNGSEASALMRKDGTTDAATALNEARRLKHFADRLKSDGSTLERTDLYFEAALKFLYVASVMELPITGNAKQGDSSQSMQLYSDTTRMLKFCAHEYESCKQMAAAALAYKCVEVAYMKIAFLKHPGASKDQHGSEQNLQTNAIATNRIGPDFMRLLSYMNALNSAFEATKNCERAISELASDGDDLMSSVKEVLKFNFQNVDGFLRLLQPSMASVRR